MIARLYFFVTNLRVINNFGLSICQTGFYFKGVLVAFEPFCEVLKGTTKTVRGSVDTGKSLFYINVSKTLNTNASDIIITSW